MGNLYFFVVNRLWLTCAGNNGSGTAARPHAPEAGRKRRENAKARGSRQGGRNRIVRKLLENSQFTDLWEYGIIEKYRQRREGKEFMDYDNQLGNHQENQQDQQDQQAQYSYRQEDQQGQYGNGQGFYQGQEQFQQVKDPGHSSMALASMIMGILGILTSCCCYGGMIFGGLGITFALLSNTEGRFKGYGLAGLITSIIALVLAVLALVVIMMLGMTSELGGY